MSFDPKEHLTQLKGKSYLEVKWRLVWLSSDTPNYRIDTQIVTTPAGAKGVCVRAVVDILNDSGQIVRGATAYKTSNGFAGGDLEKAETGAVGRALAFLGFGTQFAEELDGDHIGAPVDAPMAIRPEKPAGLNDRFSDNKAKRCMAIAAKLFGDLKGEDLRARVVQAAAKILTQDVASLTDLHWKDGETVMKMLEAEAIKKGVWQPNE